MTVRLLSIKNAQLYNRILEVLHKLKKISLEINKTKLVMSFN